MRFPSEMSEGKISEVEQLVARGAHNPEVAGSSPALATKLGHEFFEINLVSPTLLVGFFFGSNYSS